MTTDKSTKPGWYRAKHNGVEMCVWVDHGVGDGLVAYEGAAVYKLSAYKWGPNIDDALAELERLREDKANALAFGLELAALRSALTSAGVTPDADGVRVLAKRVDTLFVLHEKAATHIRSDERARAERDIAAFITAMAPMTPSRAAEAACMLFVGHITRSDYPKADPEPARTEPRSAMPACDHDECPRLKCARTDPSADRIFGDEVAMACVAKLVSLGHSPTSVHALWSQLDGVAPSAESAADERTVEWVDGRATVGGVVLWAAKGSLGITGIEVDDMQPNGGDAYITHPDEGTAKRLAVAVAREMAGALAALGSRPMAERKAISSRTRFEVFKRDGFRCRYCGATSLTSRLAVDHVVAVANGGTNDAENLITACVECNGGKSAVPLEDRKFVDAPDPAAIREHAQQVAAYLDACRELDAAREEFRDYLAGLWQELTGNRANLPAAFVTRLVTLVEERGIDVVRKAMVTVGARGPGGSEDHKYFNGVMRKLAANE
jgi:hypothetical protein